MKILTAVRLMQIFFLLLVHTYNCMPVLKSTNKKEDRKPLQRTTLIVPVALLTTPAFSSCNTSFFFLRHLLFLPVFISTTGQRALLCQVLQSSSGRGQSFLQCQETGSPSLPVLVRRNVKNDATLSESNHSEDSVHVIPASSFEVNL